VANGTCSRQNQILQLLLNAKSGLSIDEMASRLEISRNALKQHLVILERDQLVQKHALHTTGGRPAQSYVLSDKGINHFPKQYSWFCNLILTDLKAEMGEAAFKGYMKKLGVNLAQSLKQEFSHKSQADKITALVTAMQSLGYHAQLDLTPTETTIVAFNCVYHDLAQQHPELCEFDHALMSTLLEKPIMQTECMARNGCVCKFSLPHT
jgi:DeoR family transcriptional regulator, suf operon transcriptional repressor